jgi:Putative MetA-pathway of phenol degradation
MSGRTGWIVGLVGFVTVTCAPASASAQEMEPKAYSASPVGATFLVGSFARSTGSVVSDPSLPLTDVNAAINSAVVGVGMTFDLFGKLALVSAAVPYAWGDVSGQVFEEAREVSRAGLADTRLKLSINLRGNDAMRLAQFAKAPRQTIVGASLTMVAPTGQYDGTKLINLGTHRWGFKPEVGVAVPRGHWDVDAYAGVWFFADNGDFFPGGRQRSQDPVVAIQGHVSYTFKPRLWLAVDTTWYHGGSTQVDGGNPTEAVNNSRLGATLSLPASRRQSFKITYSSGLAVRTGSDFRTIAVGWQFLRLKP